MANEANLGDGFLREGEITGSRWTQARVFSTGGDQAAAGCSRLEVEHSQIQEAARDFESTASFSVRSLNIHVLVQKPVGLRCKEMENPSRFTERGRWINEYLDNSSKNSLTDAVLHLLNNTFFFSSYNEIHGLDKRLIKVGNGEGTRTRTRLEHTKTFSLYLPC